VRYTNTGLEGKPLRFYPAVQLLPSAVQTADGPLP